MKRLLNLMSYSKPISDHVCMLLQPGLVPEVCSKSAGRKQDMWDLCIYATQRSVCYRYNLLLLYYVLWLSDGWKCFNKKTCTSGIRKAHV